MNNATVKFLYLSLNTHVQDLLFFLNMQKNYWVVGNVYIQLCRPVYTSAYHKCEFLLLHVLAYIWYCPVVQLNFFPNLLWARGHSIMKLDSKCFNTI